MKVMVVTGGIGSGKSLVCRILNASYGYPVYEADAKVKELYASKPVLLDAIEAAIGMTVRDADGKFSPRMLAAAIFTDREALEKVETVVFPALKEDFAAFAALHSDKEYVVFESATVLEKRQFDGFGDVTVLVDAPFEVRLERAVARDGMPREKVLERMANQKLMNELSNGGKDSRIGYVIVNDGMAAEVGEKVAEMLKKLSKQKC